MTHIELLPALDDNYIFMIHNNEHAVVVDPADPRVVLTALQERNLELVAILNTHHHADHVGGNKILKSQTGCTIHGWAMDNERIPGIDIQHQEGDQFVLLDEEFHLLAVPGHTTGHCAYHAPGLEAAFVGDTLFALGCGRMFEGTPPMFWGSLKKLRALPPKTKIYCAHEYTLANAKFACAMDPQNKTLLNRVEDLKAQRARQEPTIPVQLADEIATNPFLRADQEDLVQQLGMQGSAAEDVFAHLRQAKDHF